MKKDIFKNTFIQICINKKFEKNNNQVEIADLLDKFIKPTINILDFFSHSSEKLCFYLYGGVGVGKTMIFDYFYDYINVPKKRFHFNEFMIDFHEFRHKNKSNSISSFVKKLKINKLLYLDEFQVTNIVDAMILGQLFEKIFSENIKVLITSNIKVDNLYKDGLQREQFLPFISIIKKHSIQKELIIDEDYRKIGSNKLQRAFSPINERNTFKINQIFRELTKNSQKQKIKLNIKGRDLIIQEYYNGIAKFDFKQLCSESLGAEDYIKISNKCKFILIENIPFFSDENADQQQRFITLIDILYENKIHLMISMVKPLDKIGSSVKLVETFKRTTSRIFELTSPNPEIF